MSEVQIDNHLSQFDDGAIRFTSRTIAEQKNKAGPDGGFVMPKSEFDKIVSESGGNLRIVEVKLGLTRDYLSGSDTMVAFIEPKNMNHLRIPSGNESGVNTNWLPGGFTSGGVPEAVMDFGNVPFTEINLGGN